MLQQVRTASLPVEPGNSFAGGCGTQEPVPRCPYYTAGSRQEMHDIPEAKDQREQFLLYAVCDRGSSQREVGAADHPLPVGL